MPITENNYAEAEKERNSKGLDVNTTDYYFNKMRPYLKEMYMKCKTDGELLRTIEKIINAADSFCQAKDYTSVAESFNAIEAVITRDTYFNKAMKNAPEAEKEMVRGLISKIADLRMIIKCEPPIEPKEKKEVQRIGYQSPIGENEDFATHNMKKLTEPKPKQRIPNV